MAFAIILFAEAAGATTWSPGTYSLGVGAFSPASLEKSADKNFVQLSGYGLLGSRTVPTLPAAQQGSGGEVVSTSSAAPVQLGSVGLASWQPAAPGTLQLSGYHGNMGGYTNIFYPSFLLGGSFGGAGGGGCGGCG
ncbi:hypothetical protein [Candidatus Methanocrinis natronophilus]|uniref:DUF4266 domain-containing protein n=1 Tax=Candidatus Methanocrinis natronophilus TaxID=3033396 RepID=A0ABT5X5T0_9EURY|nr:hypothetical protein [Candidatus Methanocrinis natronophilus]MDF0590057.1 hypothetical protein [Candidatus Methanocrinis natronophilus]